VIGPITDAERRGWQRRTVRVLADLLDGPGRDLAPLRWTVAARAGLVGFVESHDATIGRQHFEAWVEAIGARPWPERDLDFKVTLTAERKHYDGLVTIGLVADLDKPEDDR
jgi:hypothetical protein